MKYFDGLGYINIELTSRCNAKCWMCGRRKTEREHPELCNFGDMDFNLVKRIASQLPKRIVTAMHFNGCPLLYPKLGEALFLFKNQTRVLDTNAILLVKKADDIINNLDTITISVIENDPIGDAQFETVKEFIKIKGNRKPRIIYRLLGKIDKAERWYKLPGIIATRTLHHPMGSYSYEKRVITPEIGICLEMLGHLVIDRYGDVYPCVRYNLFRENILGNVKVDKLVDIWNGKKRQALLQKHIDGKRNEIPFCNKCQFWGCPIG